MINQQGLSAGFQTDEGDGSAARLARVASRCAGRSNAATHQLVPFPMSAGALFRHLFFREGNEHSEFAVSRGIRFTAHAGVVQVA